MISKKCWSLNGISTYLIRDPDLQGAGGTGDTEYCNFSSMFEQKTLNCGAVALCMFVSHLLSA